MKSQKIGMIANLKVSPSLLEAFANVLTGKYNETESRLIDKINKVGQYQETEAMRMGTAFHRLTERPVIYNQDNLNCTQNKNGEICYRYGFWDFKKELADKVSMIRSHGLNEQWVSRDIDCGAFGPVRLYGIVDNIQPLHIVDLKTTKNYYDYQYWFAWQWRLYLYCAKSPRFTYLITDFENIYTEEYFWYDDIEGELKKHVYKYFEFIHDNVDKINLQLITL